MRVVIAMLILGTQFSLIAAEPEKIELPLLNSICDPSQKICTVGWQVENPLPKDLKYVGSRVSCSHSSVICDTTKLKNGGSIFLTAEIKNQTNRDESVARVEIKSDFVDEMGRKAVFRKPISINFRLSVKWLVDHINIHDFTEIETKHFVFSDSNGDMDSVYKFRFENNWQIENSSREMTTDAGRVISLQLKRNENFEQGSEQIPITVFKQVARDGFVQISKQIVEIKKTPSFGIRPKTIPKAGLRRSLFHSWYFLSYRMLKLMDALSCLLRQTAQAN